MRLATSRICGNRASVDFYVEDVFAARARGGGPLTSAVRRTGRM